ncbi:MAG: cardiolipin synthase [Treponemataceae bacterium]|nr:cardiolipin synthase [Treponemataceae bacterium]
MEITWNIFSYLITSLQILFILFILFFERKDAGRKFSWMFIIYFLPGVGIFLYFMLSGHFFTKTRKMDNIQKYIYSRTTPYVMEQEQYFEKIKSKIKNKTLIEYSDIVKMNFNNAISNIAYTETISEFTNGKDMFKSLIEDLESAEKSIFMEFFIFREDDIGKQIMDILCRKAENGVDVKLLYDDFGSLLTRRFFFRKLDNAGGSSIPFFPIRIGPPLTVNFRNHRKNVIIDEKIGYIGGINIGDEYIIGLGKNPDKPWRDTHLRMTGSCVAAMLITFMIDYYSCAYGKKSIKSLKKTETYFPLEKIESLNNEISDNLMNDVPGDDIIPVQLLLSSPNDNHKHQIRDCMIRMIMNAKESIYIETPYFTPDEAFFSALKLASMAGRKVYVIVPRDWDKSYVKAAAFQFIREIMEYGVKFYAYPGFIHSKMLIIDDKLITIGTTNIDTRSFELHFEMNMVFYDEGFAKYNSSIFKKDLEKSEEMELAWFNSRFILQRTVWSFCKLFSPIM